MQLATCQLIYNEFKSSVTKTDITPAEAQLLFRMHGDSAGETAVKIVKITGEVKRSSAEEKDRLCSRYLRKSDDSKKVTVESLWPGVSARLPENFSEVVDKDGKPCFKPDGTAINAVAPTDILIAGKVYTKEQLEKLVAAQVKVAEVPDEELDSTPLLTPPTPPTPLVTKPGSITKPSTK